MRREMRPRCSTVRSRSITRPHPALPTAPTRPPQARLAVRWKTTAKTSLTSPYGPAQPDRRSPDDAPRARRSLEPGSTCSATLSVAGAKAVAMSSPYTDANGALQHASARGRVLAHAELRLPRSRGRLAAGGHTHAVAERAGGNRAAGGAAHGERGSQRVLPRAPARRARAKRTASSSCWRRARPVARGSSSR